MNLAARLASFAAQTAVDEWAEFPLTVAEAVELIEALEPRAPGFEGWADVELMGHRSRIAHVREIELGHRGFLELTWKDGDTDRCEIYAPGAVFSLTPLDGEAAADELRSVREAQPW